MGELVFHQSSQRVKISVFPLHLILIGRPNLSFDIE